MVSLGDSPQVVVDGDMAPLVFNLVIHVTNNEGGSRRRGASSKSGASPAGQTQPMHYDCFPSRFESLSSTNTSSRIVSISFLITTHRVGCIQSGAVTLRANSCVGKAGNSQPLLPVE